MTIVVRSEVARRGGVGEARHRVQRDNDRPHLPESAPGTISIFFRNESNICNILKYVSHFFKAIMVTVIILFLHDSGCQGGARRRSAR